MDEIVPNGVLVTYICSIRLGYATILLHQGYVPVANGTDADSARDACLEVDLKGTERL